MGVLATDDFNRANGGLGANWTTATSSGAPQIDTNVVRTNVVATDSRAYYNAVSFPNDQYSQIVVVAITSNTGAVSAATRVDSGTLSSYMARGTGPTGASAVLAIDKYTSGVFVTITSATKTINVSDVIKMESNGTSQTAYINGVAQLGPTSDSANTAGKAGVFVFVDVGNAVDAELDTWEGGDLAAGGAPWPIIFTYGTDPVIQLWDWVGLY